AYEGFGLVLVEAMASRLPVVATRAGAIPEIVVDGQTGLLIRPGQPQELADALHTLSDVALRPRLGEAGLHRVLQEFTLERMYQETDRLYDQVCRGRLAAANGCHNGEALGTNRGDECRRTTPLDETPAAISSGTATSATKETPSCVAS